MFSLLKLAFSKQFPWASWYFPLSSPICDLETPQYFFKVNFDGVVFRYENATNIGVVIMHDNELVVASMAEKIHLPSMVTFVEALATIKALSLTHDFGLSAIV